MTLTRAEPSCSSAKILHAESGFQCREPCSAPFCLAWMILLSSYPSGRGFFFCQKQDDFPATGTVSVDSVGGSQKLDASNHMSLAVFSANGIPENHTIAPGTAMRRSKGLLAP